MKNAIYTAQGRFVAAGLLLALLLVSCETPMEQGETFGHVVTWSIDQEPFAATATLKTLNWLNDDQLAITGAEQEGTPSTRFVLVLDNKPLAQVDSWVKELEQIEGVHALEWRPLQQEVKRSQYLDELRVLRVHRIKTSALEERFEAVKQEYLDVFRAHGIQAAYGTLPDGGGVIHLAYRPLKQWPDEDRKALGGTLEQFIADVLLPADRPQYTKAEQREGAIKELTFGIERLQEKVQQTTDQAERDEMLQKIQRFKKRLEELRTVKKEQ